MCFISIFISIENLRTFLFKKVAGVPPEKLVEAHGTFYSASCIECGKSQDPEQVKKEIFSDKVVRCVDCNVE